MDKEFEEIKQFVSHESHCRYSMSNIPINECECDCYEKHFWNASKQYRLDKDKETINRLCDELIFAATKLDAHTGDTFFGDRLREAVEEVKGD